MTPGCVCAILRFVKPLFAILALFATLLPCAGAGEKVFLYARLLETSDVVLTTGAKWRMDKGDAFPVVAYKEAHTVVILQLAGAQFMMAADKTQLVPEKELPAAIEKYRTNVTGYINGYSDRWIKNAQEGKPPQ